MPSQKGSYSYWWIRRWKPMEDVDVLITIVGNWIDKPERALRMVEAGKMVMLFFNAFQDPKNTIPSEREEVITFKEHMKDHYPCIEYGRKVELEKKNRRATNLTLIM